MHLGSKRNLCSPKTTSAELARTKDGWSPQTYAFLPSLFLYLTARADLFLLTPGLVTCPPPQCHMVVEEAALSQPVVSALIDNGLLVSCCGPLQSSAASLSTLHRTSFPALPWTLLVQDTRRAFFCWARCRFPPKEEQMGQINRWGLPCGQLEYLKSAGWFLILQIDHAGYSVILTRLLTVNPQIQSFKLHVVLSV